MDYEDKRELENSPKLGEILVHYKIITSQQLEEALEVQKNTGKRIGEILLDKEWVTQDEINWTLSKQLDIPYVQINLESINPQLSKNIPEYVLKKFKFLPLTEVDEELVVAMADPTDAEAKEIIHRLTTGKLKIVLASYKNINDVLDLIFKKMNI